MSTYLIYNADDELEEVVELSDKDYKAFKKRNPDVIIVPSDEGFIDNIEELDDDFIEKEDDEWL